MIDAGASACDPISAAVVVLQFKIEYLLSELTSTVKSKMAAAIANVIGVDAMYVFLRFTEINLQRRQLMQQKGVLVDVILLGFKGSPAVFASNLTESNINRQMVASGLKQVQIISATNEQSNGSGTSNSTPQPLPISSNQPVDNGAIIGGVIGGVAIVAVAGAACIYFRKQKLKVN
jgi:hypothetical protein